MKLLSDLNEEVEYITEAAEDGASKNYYLQGTFLQGEMKNRNGRFYPMPVLEKEVERYIKESIGGRCSYGELNHPENPSINLDKVSHLITELKRDGNNYIGKAKILTSTPNGKIVQALMQENCQLGVSSRGLGAIKESKGMKIVESLHLTTAADIVANPSAPDALPQNVMERVLEETEWFFSGTEWIRKERAFNLTEEFKRQSREDRDAKFIKLFNDLFKK